MPDYALPSSAGGVAESPGGLSQEFRILLFEDRSADADRIERELVRNNVEYKLRRVLTREAFRSELLGFAPSLVISDYTLPGLSGLDAIRLARATAPAVPIVVVTSSLGDEAAAECILAGADDYVLKEKLGRLIPAIAGAVARRQAAESVTARQRHTREMLDAIPEGVVEFGPDERIRYTNRRFCDLLGYTAEELVGRRGLEVLVNGGRRETSIPGRAGEPERLELPVHRKSGELLWVELCGTPVADERGVPSGSLCIVREISARKAEENALREREANISAAFRSNPLPMCIATLDRDEYVEVNDRFLELAGRRREEVIGRTAAELGLADRPEERSALVERLVREGRVSATETRPPSASLGSRIWRSTRQLLQYGGRQCILSVIEDITERKRAEDRLSESERRIAMFSESAFEGIAVSENRRIVDANEQLARMLGVAPGGLIGRDILDFVADEWKERVAEEMRTGSGLAYEPLLKRSDGTLIPVECRGRNFVYQGRPARVTAVHDITLQRRHEALLDGGRRVLELIARGTPLRETLETLVKVVETLTPDMLSSVLLLDPDGVHLRHAAAPSLPPDYVHAIDGTAIGERAGSCGTAAFRGEQVIVEDIAIDPLWDDYRSLALAHGLRACWSTPIFDRQGRVLGTFAMYFRTPRRPSEEHLRIMKTATHTASFAILKNMEGEALRLSEEKFSRAFRLSPDSITISRVEDGRFIETNDGFERISGFRRDEAVGRTAIELGLWPNAEQRGRLVEGLRQEGSVREMDVDFTVKDGRVLSTKLSAERIVINGEECLLATARDVTEQKRADEELRRTSAQIIEVLERVTDGFMALDKDWQFVYVNANAAAMIGRDQQSIRGKHIWTEFPEGVGLKFHEAYEKAWREQQALSLEEYFPPWKKWFENRIYPSPDGLSIYFRDITERKRAEVLLRESEQRYQNLLQSVEGIVWEADAETFRYTFVSHQAERLLGYPGAQWLSDATFWQNHLHPDDREQMVAYRTEQAGGAEPRDLEYRMLHADGRVVWFRDIAGAVTEGERQRSFRGLMIDITEQKQASEALRLSEAKFRAVAETVTAAIFVYRGDEFLYVNNGAGAITGYTVGELAAEKFSRIIHPDFMELVRGWGDLRILGEEAPVRYELRLVTKSGGERWVDFTAGLMEFDGKRAALGLAFDITDRKIAEELLQHTTEQLRALSAHLQSIREDEQKRIAREIHDQLGQAMTGLRMDVSWIAKRLTAEQGDLRQRADGMRALIDDTIQSIRRISAELRPAVLDNLGLVPALEWQAKEYQTRTGIVCELHLPEEPPPIAAESSTAAFRIFQETMTNVARHAGADRVAITLTVEGDELTLIVADNGKGIRPEDVGKSLGLVGMRERAMAVGGTITVTGEPGKGTTMTLRLPSQRANPAH